MKKIINTTFVISSIVFAITGLILWASWYYSAGTSFNEGPALGIAVIAQFSLGITIITGVILMILKRKNKGPQV